MLTKRRVPKESENSERAQRGFKKRKKPLQVFDLPDNGITSRVILFHKDFYKVGIIFTQRR